MNLDLNAALQTFFVEARELLQSMEEALLRIEQEPDDAETVNAIFRAAHTIKGSAGLFNLDAIVDFTHVLESVLDRVRDGSVAIDPTLAALFLESCDHIAALVDALEAGDDEPEPGIQERGEALKQRLGGYLEPENPDAASTHSDLSAPHDEPVEVSGGGLVETDNWHISIRFGNDVLRNGLDPLSFIRYLGKLGEIVGISTLTDALPPAGEMDPESCYLGFEINFCSDAGKEEIENVFEFVRDDATIRILPPRSRISAYAALIQELPEEEMLLGEILIKCGSLTENELREALRSQSDPDAENQRPIGEMLVDEQLVQPAVVQAALDKQQQIRETRSRQNQVIRVDADKLDQLINLVGELVIAGAGAGVIAHRTGVVEMTEATSLMSRLIEEVRDSALTLRMVQIGDTFNRFQRVVRDTSRELGKDIALEISGAETELDKTVVEKIGDPLMHLVRNAMDHGIEQADIRQQRGKSSQALLRLNAYHESGSIVIEVADDGGGLDRERIIAKAVEKGLVSDPQSLSDTEVYNLIFEAGFSTTEQVSNLSGRGVGMDVVRRNIEALRGTIEIDSVPERGTTIRIRLPLTLAIIDGFLVGVGSAGFVIPLDMVLECIELPAAERDAQGGKHVLNLRGEVLPFVRLREEFDIEGAAAKRENVVVVQYAGKKAGLVVDELHGEFQTVIKPLGRLFRHLRGVSGSTILGSGEVALILDVPGLVQRTTSRETQQVAFGMADTPAPA